MEFVSVWIYPIRYINKPELHTLHKQHIKEVDPMAIDPICKMKVDEKTAKWKSIYKGKMYYFCAPGCKAEFDKNPEKYVS